MSSTISRRTSTAALALAVSTLITSTAFAATVYDIPTGASPSPLFGALPFTQEMQLFEEFGTSAIPATNCIGCTTLPAAQSCTSGPDGAALDNFLKQQIWPLPTREANTGALNAWHNKVNECVYQPVGKQLLTSVLEGRPGGEWFAHQRWSEFKPSVYFQSAQAGARNNGGMRDAMQRHGYIKGEFKLGGLYYRGGTTKNTQVRLHPKMPVQKANSVWTFDGTLPPKLLMARYGESVLFRHFNALPVDRGANMGFGRHTISTHYHNGHHPAESDGYTAAFFFPGQYYDYRWPMVLAGHDTVNTNATDPHAGTPNGAGGTTLIRGDWRETMSTHWFHDHMLDYTAQNVYKGNAAMANLYSAVDRGREGWRCHYQNPVNVNLCLPSGTALDWGNRDYDVNLLIADKAWDAQGQLFFNIFNVDGFLGDRMTVNWQYKPYMNVRARRYRFRILNGSVSRYLKLTIATAAGQRVPFHLVGNDGNIMEHAVAFPNAQSQDLPEQGIAERYDIVVDFKQVPPGTKLYMYNVMEHKNGRRPNGTIPLADVAANRYAGDPGVGSIMEFRVVAQAPGAVDYSMNPADYTEGKKKMIPLPRPTSAELASARHHTFEFGRSGGTTDDMPWTIKTDGGPGFNMDSKRVSAAPTKDTLEIWHLRNGDNADGADNGWSHPVHIHFEEGMILARDGLPPPAWERWARKDVFRIGPGADSSGTVDLAIRFREFMGTFMEHCHNTQHEDHAMLLRWDVRNPGQTIAIPSPKATWEGVMYEDSYDLETAVNGAPPVAGAP
ncbi:MAG: multicopper oxidase domain-containing protein [Alphaproteobacteria bacterium]|nr:multicopper oxidase domain-containing protein [Alphaproteobacteria bacterium]